eukprot:c18182_g1_i1.p1 GENE.c18182_g1_i1~~c18182_g1_i1.p1  ORF type:complete len:267 (+),score=68.28 c18182_g1_i1:183-983(+)
MVFIPWEILGPWIEANKMEIGAFVSLVVMVIVVLAVWWRRSQQEKDVESRLMQRLSGDLDWFNAHFKPSFKSWLQRCTPVFIGATLKKSADEWQEMYDLVREGEVSGGQGNLFEMIKSSNIPAICAHIKKTFSDYVEHGQLAETVYFLLDATGEAQQRKPARATIGSLRDEVDADWAMTNIAGVVLKRKQDRAALFPFSEGMSPTEYHLVEIIASHYVSTLQRLFLSQWVTEHANELALRPYRSRTPDACLSVVGVIASNEKALFE